EDFDAKSFLDLTEDELRHYLEANVAAVAEVAELARPDVALANHAVMGPVVLQRGLAGGTPYAVKIHGSALEYTVRRDPGRFLPYAREGVHGAAGVVVGSRHMAGRVLELMPEVPDHARPGPAGVDVGGVQPSSSG